MRNPGRANAPPPAVPTDARCCPKCGGAGLIRVRRRFVDRVASAFVRLRRFRCTHPECQWEGNLRKRKQG